MLRALTLLLTLSATPSIACDGGKLFAMLEGQPAGSPNAIFDVAEVGSTEGGDWQVWLRPDGNNARDLVRNDYGEGGRRVTRLAVSSPTAYAVTDTQFHYSALIFDVSITGRNIYVPRRRPHHPVWVAHGNSRALTYLSGVNNDANQGIKMARLAPSQAMDLRRVNDIPIPALRALADRLALTPPSIKLSVLREVMMNSLGGEEHFGSLLRWVYFIKSLTMTSTPPSSALAVFSQIAENARTEDNIDLGSDRVSILAEVAESSQFYAVWQAQRLANDAEHILQSANIVIDCRPVFDQDRTDVVGQLFMPFLKINVSTNNEIHSLSIALDTQDIESLQIELAKLSRKLEVLKQKSGSLEFYTVGEERDFGSV